MITQEELTKILHYDPSTGLFTWKEKRNSNIVLGSEAGYLTKDGRRKIGLSSKSYLASRLVYIYMTGKDCRQYNIEHINGDRSDNRWENLRINDAPKNITQEILKEYLQYDPITGTFHWIKKVRPPLTLGEAGHPDKEYVRIRLFGKLYKAHRLAFLYMTGEFPDGDIDHINHNGLDNRWENLRSASRPENNKNKKPGKNNTSGKTGVAWAKKAQKWVVRLGGNKGRIHIGYFDSFPEAVSAREKAERELDYHPNHGKIQ